MAFTFTLKVQEEIPVGVAPGTIWLKKSQGIMQIYFSDNNFAQMNAGKSNLSIADGTYYKTVIESANLTPPSSPAIGDIWLQSGRVYWIYLGKWQIFGGN